MKPQELDAFLTQAGAATLADYLNLLDRTSDEALDERMKWAAWHFRDPDHADEAQFLLTHCHALADLLDQGEATWRKRWGSAATILPVEELFAPREDDSVLLDQSMVEPSPHPLRRVGTVEAVPPDPTTTGNFTFVDWQHLHPITRDNEPGLPTNPGPIDAELSTSVQPVPAPAYLLRHPATTAVALAIGLATALVGAGFLAGVLLHVVTREVPPTSRQGTAPLVHAPTTAAPVPSAAPSPLVATVPAAAPTTEPAPEPLTLLGTWEGTGGFGDTPALRLRLYTLNKGRVDGRLIETRGGLEVPIGVTGTWDGQHITLRGADGRSLDGRLSGTTLTGDHAADGRSRRWMVAKQ